MNRKIFLNLPVKSLDASKAFFAALGLSLNAQFSGDDCTCLVISDDIYVMLLTEKRFSDFAPNAICDAKRSNEVLICVSCDSRGEVDEIARKGVAAGATVFEEPMDYGFMYARSFQDLDGHGWNWMWMDPSHVQQPQAEAPAAAEGTEAAMSA